MMTKTRSVTLGLAIVVLGSAGCGSDTKKEPDAYATAGPTRAAFCAAMAKVDAPFVEAGQYASREQKVDAAKKVVDILNDTAKAAPPEIADAANTKLAAIRSAAGGEPSSLIDSKALDATQKVKEYCPT
jgi:hypothetical protein